MTDLTPLFSDLLQKKDSPGIPNNKKPPPPSDEFLKEAYLIVTYPGYPIGFMVPELTTPVGHTHLLATTKPSTDPEILPFYRASACIKPSRKHRRFPNRRTTRLSGRRDESFDPGDAFFDQSS